MRGAAIALLLAATTARADPDPWFGSDKALHFGFSSALAIAGYGAATTFSPSPKVRAAYGASVALLAGIGKELWDASGPGGASAKDLTWDLLGTAVGVAICWVLDELVFGRLAAPAAQTN
ncbi:MAG: putative lipoprotein [Myxococcaceae bacterium]|nr:putative lipoprotein [Myxococcaceae bacterium]